MPPAPLTFTTRAGSGQLLRLKLLRGQTRLEVGDSRRVCARETPAAALGQAARRWRTSHSERSPRCDRSAGGIRRFGRAKSCTDTKSAIAVREASVAIRATIVNPVVLVGSLSPDPVAIARTIHHPPMIPTGRARSNACHARGPHTHHACGVRSAVSASRQIVGSRSVARKRIAAKPPVMIHCVIRADVLRSTPPHAHQARQLCFLRRSRVPLPRRPPRRRRRRLLPR